MNPVICNNLEGCDGVRSGRKVHEGGDICIRMPDSCCCMAEQLKIKLMMKHHVSWFQTIYYKPTVSVQYLYKNRNIGQWNRRENSEITHFYGKVIYNNCRGDRDQDHPHGKEMQKKTKLLSGETLQIAVKRREAKTKEKRKDISIWMQSSKE